MLRGGGGPFKVTFKYEKLLNFRYRCSLLNHVLRFCGEVEMAPSLLYGLWFRAEGECLPGGRNRGPGRGVGRRDQRNAGAGETRVTNEGDEHDEDEEDSTSKPRPGSIDEGFEDVPRGEDHVLEATNLVAKSRVVVP